MTIPLRPALAVMLALAAAPAAAQPALQDIVNGWADSIRALGVEVKGLWLVDFYNGEGYYCWKYPEDTVWHYHGYVEGFAGRISIQ